MVPREIREQAVRSTPHETGRGNPFTPMSTTSATYTVGRSEGVVYPPGFPYAPTVPQLAELYDQQARRVAALEEQVRQSDRDIAALLDWLASIRHAVGDPDARLMLPELAARCAELFHQSQTANKK